MADKTRLDIQKTYKAILNAAREKRFISYGELSEASNVPSTKGRLLVHQQLGHLATIAHERGWPLLSAIVVSKDKLDSGKIEGTALSGFLSAAEMVGIDVDDPESFVRDQQEQVFEWAKTAPDRLDDSEVEKTARGQGPRFIQYFEWLLDSLRDLGGEATPPDVYSWIKSNCDVPEQDISNLTKSGQPKYENDIGWARFYLVKAGLIDGSKRGIWSLTAKGIETKLDYTSALALFKDVYDQFKTTNHEDAPPPESISPHELFDNPDRKFWFVGAAWGGTNDQLDRFLSEGIWQNGYDEKFSEHVRRMRPGDKIAIKAAFTQKYNLPFDNRGKPVSCMRIKAIGTITEKTGDGKTVKVDWERLEPPRDWFFYTYRVTLVEADPNEALARRLILFTFAGATQNYDFWITEVPYFAKRYSTNAKPASIEDPIENELEETEEEASNPTYSVDNILEEGSFLPREALDQFLDRVQSKRNLILQGPPGTGKTWLAKKLAYALLGSKDRKVTRGRLRIVQFHPSLSYEDFVRGWRPNGDGSLDLVDGIFLESVQAASAEPDRPFVLIIEEINRGNPAQIFGEMLTLLENTKRTADEAIELAYRREEGERVFIPKNLYVIGTMNVADRSLALVDLALRRRFAFIGLEPLLNNAWRNWCIDRCGLKGDIVEMVAKRITSLNHDITEDRSLGAQFRIGHSYVTPLPGAEIADGEIWFRDIVQTEILPLLEEYWFDATDKVEAARAKLLEGL